MKNKQTKNIFLIIGCILATPIIFIMTVIAFYSITNPTISLKPLNKPISVDIVSAKQIETHLNSEIEQIDKLKKYNLTIGSIDMHIDSENRGEVTVIFVEKDNVNSKVIFAHLDTCKGIFYGFEDYGRESKLYPGIIRLKEWKIDSTDAIRISEEFFSDNKDFRYDEIWLISSSYYMGSEETWNVYLTDKENNIRYEIRMNPYSGEVFFHNINEYE